MQAPSRTLPRLAERQQRRKSLISLTPLIDVVFILLVFFMLASTFLDWRSIVVQTVIPPSGASPAEPLDKPLLVTVAQNQIQLNGQVLSIGQLMAQLKQVLDGQANAWVYIKPVGDTALQPVIQLLDQFKSAGINRVRLMRDTNWQTIEQQP
jgi:biopolymer transport protein ExbD